MKTFKLFTLLAFIMSFSSQILAQGSTHYYVIQLATYGSWEDFAKDEEKFYANTGTSDNNIYAEQTGNYIKVYLLDSQEGNAVFFYDYDRIQEVLAVVRKNPNWKGAFRKGNINWDNLIYYGDVFEQYNQTVPEEFSDKGKRINIQRSEPASYYGQTKTDQKVYKVQLGVFKEEKSRDFIAKAFGFSEDDLAAYDRLVSYDFVKVGKDICRRYFVGNFSSKKTAEPFKEEFERKSNQQLLITAQ